MWHRLIWKLKRHKTGKICYFCLQDTNLKVNNLGEYFLVKVKCIYNSILSLLWRKICVVLDVIFPSLELRNLTKLRGLSPRAICTDQAIRLLAKLVLTFEGSRWQVVSVTEPYSRNFGFLERSRYFYFQVSPQLYSRGWVNLVPDPLILRKSGSAGNVTRTSGSVAKNPDR
jgi:hypothetical protein